MLLIWDRGSFSYGLISAVVRRGAHLMARVKSNTVLRPIRRLPDGSYPAENDRELTASKKFGTPDPAFKL